MKFDDLVNLFNDKYEINFSTLFLETTNQCNFNCRHCYNNSGRNEKKELDFKYIKKVVKNINTFGCNKIVLSGGEFFLYSKWKELVIYLKKMNFELLIITNSLMLNDERISFIIDNDIHIQISLDGYNKQINDYIRSNGSFDSVIKALERLVHYSYTKNVVLNVVLNNKNYHNIIEYYRLAEKYDVDLAFNLVNEIGQAKINKLALNTYQFLEITESLKKIKTQYDSKVIKPTFNCRFMILYKNKYLLNPVISYNGNVFLCEKLRADSFAVGNIYEDSLFDILYSERFKDVIGQINLRKDFINCKNCIINDFCDRGCPAESANKCDSIFSTDKCTERLAWYKNNLGKVSL